MGLSARSGAAYQERVREARRIERLAAALAENDEAGV